MIFHKPEINAIEDFPLIYSFLVEKNFVMEMIMRYISNAQNVKNIQFYFRFTHSFNGFFLKPIDLYVSKFKIMFFQKKAEYDFMFE